MSNYAKAPLTSHPQISNSCSFVLFLFVICTKHTFYIGKEAFLNLFGERHVDIQMVMANKSQASSLICNKCIGWGDLTPSPHYPPTPKQSPKNNVEGLQAKALFSVIGMTDSTCAGPVKKAIKRLPGIHEAVVDVLNNRTQVQYNPTLVNVSLIFKHFRFTFHLMFCLFVFSFFVITYLYNL